jgi:hypothetical protein
MIHILEISSKEEIIDVVYSSEYDDAIDYIVDRIITFDDLNDLLRISGLYYYNINIIGIDEITKRRFCAIDVCENSGYYEDSYQWYYTVMYMKFIPFMRNKKLEELGL